MVEIILNTTEVAHSRLRRHEETFVSHDNTGVNIKCDVSCRARLRTSFWLPAVRRPSAAYACPCALCAMWRGDPIREDHHTLAHHAAPLSTASPLVVAPHIVGVRRTLGCGVFGLSLKIVSSPP